MLKKILLPIILIAGCSITSCNIEIDEMNSIAEDIQLVLEDNNLRAVQWCCIDCSCDEPIAFEGDFSFPGDNFIKIRDVSYNLNILVEYKIESISPTSSQALLILYFN